MMPSIPDCFTCENMRICWQRRKSGFGSLCADKNYALYKPNAYVEKIDRALEKILRDINNN